MESETRSPEPAEFLRVRTAAQRDAERFNLGSAPYTEETRRAGKAAIRAALGLKAAR